jgi:hypothetical protein
VAGVSVVFVGIDRVVALAASRRGAIPSEHPPPADRAGSTARTG